MTATKPRRSRLDGVPDSAVIKALGETGAIISDAARVLTREGTPVSRSTLSRHISRSAKLQEARRAIEVAAVGFARNSIFDQVKAGDWQATRYFLSKSGGYR